MYRVQGIAKLKVVIKGGNVLTEINLSFRECGRLPLVL